jgi:predicted double-glycine peptidase
MQYVERLLVAAVLTFVATLAAATERVPRVRSLAEIRHEGVVMQRWDLSCGAAALATLFTHDLRHPVTERQVATAMLRAADPARVRTRGGFSLLDMQTFAESLGFRADGYGELSAQDLAGLVPAIVPLSLRAGEHFVVVRRLDAHSVLVADPAFGRREMPFDVFERAWKRRIAFVVSAP